MLNVAVMLDSTKVRTWELWMLERIHRSPDARITLAIVDGTPRAPRPPRALKDKLFNPPRDLVWSKYRDWDYRRQRGDNDAYRWVDASELFSDVTIHRTVPSKPKSYEFRFDEACVDLIRNAEIDVMLRLGFGIVRGEILDTPRFGTWSFHRGDNHKFRGNPGLFWEIHDGDPVSGTVLQRLTDTLDGGHVLYRSSAATNFDSYQLSRNPIQWKTAQFVERVLTLVAAGGWDAVVASPHYEPPAPNGPKARRNPSNPEMLKFLARRGVRQSTKLLRRKRASAPTVNSSFSWESRVYRATVVQQSIVVSDDSNAVVSSITLAAPASDPVVATIDGALWLFTTVAVPGASLDDELWLFRATTPSGPWVPHAANPVVSNAAAARPSGPVEVTASGAVREVWNAIERRRDRYAIATLDLTEFAQSRL